MDKLGVVILGALGLVGVMVVLALFSAFTISTLWTWFIVPLGVKTVSMAQAYGISIMFSVLCGSRGLSGQSSGQVLGAGLLLNIFALIFGGIAVQFM